MQVTTLQGIWDIFDTVWGDHGPSSSTPAVPVDNRRALVELLAIEDGSVGDDDAPMADAAESSSVATTEPEQTPDDSYPNPEVPDTLLENGDDGPDDEFVVEITDSQPVNDGYFIPEEPDSQGPLEEPFDELMPEGADSQPTICDEGPCGVMGNDKGMAGDVSSDASPTAMLDSQPVVGDDPRTGTSRTDVPPDTSKDPLVEHVGALYCNVNPGLINPGWLSKRVLPR